MKGIRRVLALVVAGLLWPVGAAAGLDAGGGDDGVRLLLNGAFGSRPGELIDIDVRGVRERGVVRVSSPAFGRPVELTPYEPRTPGEGPGHHARPAVAVDARPGSHPLTVEAGGRVVARDRVEVAPSRRPRFTVAAAPGGTLRPGERLWMAYDDLYPGETGSAFSARSSAFRASVPLVHDPGGSDWHNPRLFSGSAELPPGLADGTYRVVLTGPGGRAIDERPLTVRAARPGDRDYLGRARGPALFGGPEAPAPDEARSYGHTVAAGGTVHVLWQDEAPDAGEEERLRATSPAFVRPVPLRRDDSKAGDGRDPRYLGPARVREDLAPGRYPVTVVSHHGRVKRTGRLTVTGSGASASVDAPSPAVLAGAAAATVVVVTGAVLLRRRTARPPR
ncbi:hypothetical protein [Streptomyces albireticuli]|uniref:Uncharacterized protein n=1 Tax=Streptomyces albireticuli TaxID=1940 RepID=A0A2A2DDH0_9ACTN|nr:hypothetical protein [Streptomyces albireticuli]MCD9141472.1 hypothetical protein [Streptomyces albireticuli]MCD9164277.1 hypothetical protein [Streptomyces albireticuli]MCD9196404.1 hypothetical protein [Streptomyces albireticuli]PAU49486.1 hypothetical protein CK936_07515 [Streptomyces albireticuli]